MDWIMIIPNGIGAILGFIQMFICFLVPSREEVSSAKIEVVEETEVDVEATMSNTSKHSESRS
jgi:hypothetical protein